MCSGSVVVTAYDSESGNPGSNPEWGLIYFEASITAQCLSEPSSLRGRYGGGKFSYSSLTLSLHPHPNISMPTNHFPTNPVKGLLQIHRAIQSSLFLPKYFSCGWRTMKIASVVLFLAIKPNCMLSIFTLFLNLLSMTLKNLHGMFYQLYSSVLYMSHIPVHLPSPCKHSPTNSYSNPLEFYHP